VYKRESCVYVHQQEMAVCSQDDGDIDIIGSEDATTCHVVILRNQSSSTIGLLHLDSDYQQMEALIKAMEDHDNLRNFETRQLDVFIIGGFSDSRSLSLEISTDVFQNMIQEETCTFHLKLCCSLEINTIVKDNTNWPIHYGAGVRLETGEVFPAKFEYHGPDLDIRMLRYTGNTEPLLLYATDKNKAPTLQIPAFDYRALSCSQAKEWLSVPDDYLLAKCSTSPLVEPASFCDDMRSKFRRMITDPKPLLTIFKDGRTREYKRDQDTGDWCLQQPELYDDGGKVDDKSNFSVLDFVASMKK